jgi:hypothetical protein
MWIISVYVFYYMFRPYSPIFFAIKKPPWWWPYYRAETCGFYSHLLCVPLRVLRRCWYFGHCALSPAKTPQGFGQWICRHHQMLNGRRRKYPDGLSLAFFPPEDGDRSILRKVMSSLTWCGGPYTAYQWRYWLQKLCDGLILYQRGCISRV